MDMQIAVILPAAGTSSRFSPAPPGSSRPGSSRPGSSRPESSRNKIELDLAGRPVFLRSLEAFLGRKDVAQIILAVQPNPPEALDAFRFRWQEQLGFHGITLVPGGTKDRWETVQRALEAVDSNCTHVAIHDAARPLVSKSVIDRVFAAAQTHDAVIPAMPCSSTLKRVELLSDDAKEMDPLDAILGSDSRPDHGAQRIIETIDRTNLVEAQTPQIFTLDLIRLAYAQPHVEGATDDASLVEALGEPVTVVEGESTNLKITRPADLELASAWIAQRDAASAKQTAAKRLFADEDE